MHAGHLPRVLRLVRGCGGMRVFAPAKINLHLAVGGMRADGYHDVTTVLHTLAFGDTVVIEPHSGFGFSCAPDLGLKPEENLACKAANAMAGRFGRPLDIRLAVNKAVPAGAGLGGASADAAATIAGLARLWGIDSVDDALVEVASALGADVPFFLVGGSALYSGRGDVLDRRLPALDSAIALVKPAPSVNTGQAYVAFESGASAASPDPDALIESLASCDAREAGRHLFNNMTGASVRLVPEIAGALRLVAESPGALGALMAGSGSAVFGIFETDAEAGRCAGEARAAGFWSVATRTRPAGCECEQ